MITSSKILHATLFAGLLTVGASAQKVALHLTFTVNVISDHRAAEQCTVAIYKDNVREAELPPSERATFKLELDLGASYSVRISKEGFREKTLFVDTRIPDDIRKLAPFVCNVNLEPLDHFVQADAFYLDFPSAVIRWSPDHEAFAHSASYHSNIQGKMALVTTKAGE